MSKTKKAPVTEKPTVLTTPSINDENVSVETVEVDSFESMFKTAYTPIEIGDDDVNPQYLSEVFRLHRGRVTGYLSKDGLTKHLVMGIHKKLPSMVVSSAVDGSTFSVYIPDEALEKSSQLYNDIEKLKEIESTDFFMEIMMILCSENDFRFKQCS